METFNLKSTALVTGASSGIGRALALELASHRYDLILVGRNTKALQEVADECRAKQELQVVVVSENLAEKDAPQRILRHIEKEKLKVDLLVNNAGFGVHGDFIHTDLQQEIDLIEVQIGALLKLTKGLVPDMVKRKRGGVLNIASVYSYTPVPYQAVYAASKAFLVTFANALAEELRDSCVRITTVCPGITQTEFRKRAGMKDRGTMSGWTAEAVARYAYRAYESGHRMAVPGLVNKIYVYLGRRLPSSWVAPIVRMINAKRGVSPRS